MGQMSHREFLAQDYALINPLQVPSHQYKDLKTQVLLPKGLERHERMMPLLVELKCLSQKVRMGLLERADRWARNHDMPLFSALLNTDASDSQLRSQLERRLLQSRPDGAQVWLRFHDPRVFRHLRWLLDDDQMAALMGVITSWTWFDPLGGQWSMYPRPDSQNKHSLRIRGEQWNALDQFDLLNRCLRDLVEEGSVSEDAVAQRVLEGLLAARAQGLMESGDVILYARQQFGRATPIDRFPEVAKRLRDVRDGISSYVLACESLRNEDFARLEDVV